jgi:hypothetical protein
MIQVFTLAKPDSLITAYAAELFNLTKGAYNLPQPGSPHRELFDKLYKLGVRQIIHDGKADEIVCMDGYQYATNLLTGDKLPEQDILRIKPFDLTGRA